MKLSAHPLPVRPRLAAPLALMLVTGLMALQGCATRPIERTEPNGSVAPARSMVPAFELYGRLSASDGTEAAHGQFHWQHTPDHDRLTVSTPLGQIVAQLTRNAAGAVLVLADGKRLEASDANTMLPAVLGVEAPLEALPNWVQAIPRSGARVLGLESGGRPARIGDSGWIIDYGEYATPLPDAVPRRLEASRGDTRIRLIIDEWNRLP